MRLLTSSACAVIASGFLAACSGAPIGPISSLSGATQLPTDAHFAHGFPLSVVPPNIGVRRLHLQIGQARPLKMRFPKHGLYGSVFLGPKVGSAYLPGNVYGYDYPNQDNTAPICTITAAFVNGFGVDPQGDLMVPGSYQSPYIQQTLVYGGPRICGGAKAKLLGVLNDTVGQPGDAYSQNAATGTIVVGEIVNYLTHTGDMLVCTLSAGCGSALQNSSATEYSLVAGVAIDKAGNCWESGYAFINSQNVPRLFYWPACKGDAIVVQGPNITSYGGLAIDPNGKIVATDFASNIYVYSCQYKKHKGKANETCTLLSTTPMEGESAFFNIGKDGNLVAGDIGAGTVDVYTYSPSGSTYRYSFDNNLYGTDIEAGASSPQAKINI